MHTHSHPLMPWLRRVRIKLDGFAGVIAYVDVDDDDVVSNIVAY